MNRKGQALVEFVLILPIMILILFTIFDFGNILSSKNKLESTSTDIARLVRNGSTQEEIKKDYPEITVVFSCVSLSLLLPVRHQAVLRQQDE